MSDESHVVFECPRCGRSVEPGEDYVVALEYEVEPGFTLHQMRDDVSGTAERRFHVEHFRGQLGNHFYALIEGSSSSRESAPLSISPE
jgi:hypothetical protein